MTEPNDKPTTKDAKKDDPMSLAFPDGLDYDPKKYVTESGDEVDLTDGSKEYHDKLAKEGKI